MISIDRTLLGADYSGDALARHKIYAEKAGQIDIIVFTKKPQSSDGVKSFKKRKIGDKLTIYPTNSTTKLNYVWNAFQIAREICFPRKFDLIVCQDPFLTGLAGWLVKKRLKIPLLIHFHGDFWDNKYWLREKGRWWFNWFFLLLSKFLVDGADGIRVVGSGIKDKLVKEGVNKKKIRIIPTPIDLDRFESPAEKKMEKLRKKNQNRKTVINIGRDDPSKDYSVLFKAINLVYEKHRNLAFFQIGADFYLPEKIRADENLFLTGKEKIKQEQLVDYYHASDVYVSSSSHESFGKVLIEAMAAGLPVVATATTGSKGIIIDGVNGFLVPIGNSEALAKKVLYLLNNSDKAEEMGKAGRKMVREKFGQEKIIGQMIRFWKELAKL